MTEAEAIRIVQEYVAALHKAPRPISPTGEQQAALFIVVAGVVHRISAAMPDIDPDANT
jgi:hypothetical protein